MEPQQPDPVDAWAKQYGLRPTSPVAPPLSTPAAVPSVPWGDVPRQLSVGVGKGTATTAVGVAGDLALSVGMPVYQRGEGIKWVDLADSIDEIAKAAGVTLDSRAKLAELRNSPLLAAANTPQEVGKLTEQIAEFFLLPTGKAKAAKASIGLIPKVVAAVRAYLPEAIVQGAGASALTKAQTGSTEDAKTSGVLGAVAPVAGRAAAALPTAIKNARTNGTFIGSSRPQRK